ncbi:TetR/AcrR family transcriptional regulator [Kitasatospora sp. NPDC006697]|uniref:TetR/AcrR family transcriptional regulator n=1 Tax=Kitasatospora sp. NPDC006697 TaxID=3364020 RepID=UPI003687641E
MSGVPLAGGRPAKPGRHAQVVAAAAKVFGRYGYKRSSMALIAEAAGLSRPALYQDFNGKEDVFRAMGAQLLEDVLRTAEAAARSAEGTAERLYAVLAVRLEMALDPVDAEFRAELLTEAGVVAADLFAAFKERFAALVEELLTAAAGELELLGELLPARDCALLLLDAVSGISQERTDPESARRRLRQLVELTVRSLAGARPAVAASRPS